MISKKQRADLFWGYIEYVRRKGKEAIKEGLNPTKIIKFENYLVDELNYTKEEAIQIKKSYKR